MEFNAKGYARRCPVLIEINMAFNVYVLIGVYSKIRRMPEWLC